MADEATAAAPVANDAPATTTAPETVEPVSTDATTEEKPAANGDGAAETEPAGGEVNGNEQADDVLPGIIDTPAPKDKKRKSVGGVPEHKGKKLNKKKSMPNLQLNCKPGDYFWARLKGYPPWPSIICDESMLPESLLASRPVSTARPDGSIRADFEEGGKNAKDRTYPIMFLSTNEFQWMVNTNLTPLDPEECKNPPKSKISKALQAAYDVAAENHDLQYFKDILAQWQEENEAIEKAEAAAQAEFERQEAEKAAAKAAAKDKPKKAPRKSKAADEDVEMADAEAPKSAKKRKGENDIDTPKPKKTPKVTKLNAPKTPNGEDSTKKPKPKKKVVTAPKPEEEEEAPAEISEEERLAIRHKTVLYLRHKLQKGFLTRDKAPEESEMADMNKHLATLEGHQDLEVNIIKETKIHKVLKNIVKLASIPRDDDFNFKKRSYALLEIWNQRMDAAGAAPAKPTEAATEDAKAPETNGDAHAATNGDAPNGDAAAKAEAETEAKTDAPAAETKPEEEQAAEAAPKAEATEAATNGDVAMEE